MPVTTRSQSRRSHDLLSNLENVNPCLLSKRSIKTVEDSSYITTPSNSIKNPVAFKEHRISSQKPQKRSRKHQSFDKSEQSQTATEISSSELSDSIITHWACQDCSCSQGAFDYPVDSCIRCGHKMERHFKINPDWNPNCDYVCERKGLVASIMQLLEIMRVIVIRATSQAGKSILLHLLGHHVLYKQRELEPVYIDWKTRAERNGLPYVEYLEQEKLWWQGRNAKYRPYNSEVRTLYLIDEGQESYEECDFWARDLKNRNIRKQSMFVVVCLYGVDVSVSRPPGVESRSLNINAVQRIELRSSSINNSYILFTLEETTVMVQKWATYNQYELTDDLYEYLHTAIDGHSGMVGFVLHHFDDCVSKV